MRIFDRFPPVLARDEVRNHRHRPGPVERDQGDEFLDLVDLELAQQVAHAFGFDLEHADGVAPREHLVGLGIVERQVVRDPSSTPVVRFTFSQASRTTVSVLRPRKSIFSRPASSSGPDSHWAMTLPSLSFVSGTISMSGRSPMTTPAAWVPVWRGMSSSGGAYFMICSRELVGPARLGEIDAVLLRA